jgi:hypothetical protein
MKLPWVWCSVSEVGVGLLWVVWMNGERERERVTLAYGFRVLCFRSDDVRFSIVISHKVFQTEKPC